MILPLNFSQLAPRERYMLIIGTVTLFFIIGYFMLWEPLITHSKQLEKIVTAQTATLHWMQAASIEIQQLRRQSHSSSAKTPRQSLLSLIDESTRSGILSKTNKRIEPKGEREVRVNFENVSFTELMRWLGKLYNQHQVQISTISIEGQHVPDKVKVRLTLKIEN
ncbi:type II secretion system protein M [Candidatus Parabeggiatoa sp. HSG14]|uniref:type II secretion system protein M n=1 Tax=Candidatus Parabeggiatoa sp. HSG14 TaxID=3055593 RepID=UPI0025A8E1F5|nr:type II secretion system protein M [Thiotrichales bacterium HSG14]